MPVDAVLQSPDRWDFQVHGGLLQTASLNLLFWNWGRSSKVGSHRTSADGCWQDALLQQSKNQELLSSSQLFSFEAVPLPVFTSHSHTHPPYTRCYAWCQVWSRWGWGFKGTTGSLKWVANCFFAGANHTPTTHQLISKEHQSTSGSCLDHAPHKSLAKLL